MAPLYADRDRLKSSPSAIEKLQRLASGDDEVDDQLFRPWKLVRENQASPPELQLIFLNGDIRSIPYSDQKGVWHSGDVIVAKYVEESVFFVRIEGQNIHELARGIMRRRIEWIQVVDEQRCQMLERHPSFENLNVFKIELIKRPWNAECPYDEMF